MKKTLLLAGIVLTSCSISSMELVEKREKGLLYNFLRLPKELKRYIVYLTLRTSLPLKYEQTKNIKVENILGPFALLSPDNRSFLNLLTKTPSLWEVATGQELQQFTGHRDIVISADFSPDGRFLLTGSTDKSACLWDLSTGKQKQLFTGHEKDVSSVACSPDGKTILTGSFDKTARLWDVKEGKELQRFTGNKRLVYAVLFSPDGKTILTGSSDRTVRLWNRETGKEFQKFERISVFSLITLSPDGKTVLIGSPDGAVYMYSIETGKLLQQFKGHLSSLCSARFSPDSKTIFTFSLDNSAREWDVVTGRQLFVDDLFKLDMKNKEEFRSVVCSHDRATLIFGFDDKTFLVCRLNFSLPPAEQTEALKIFIEKGLYMILNSAEEPELL